MTRKLNPLVALALVVGFALVFAVGCGKQGAQQTLNTIAGPQTAAPQSAAPAVRGTLAAKPADLPAVIRVQNAHTQELMAIADVVGTATGRLADGGLGILVLTRREGATGIPANLDGIRVESRVVGDVMAYQPPPASSTLEAGTSTGNDKECASGTIGCVIDRGGTRYFLSNNHVFAREDSASIGERIDAPGRYDAKPKCQQTPQVATLSDFEPIQFAPGTTNVIDAAIALPVAGLSFTCAEAGGYTPTSNVATAAIGMLVKKTGRTTGLTRGTVTAVNVTIGVGYQFGTATFTDQIMVDGTRGPFLRPGDSGSLLVTDVASDPVGLCFAGSPVVSFANPIAPILSRFSATVCGQ